MLPRFATPSLLALLAFSALGDTTFEPPKLRLPDTSRPVRYAVDLTVLPGQDTFRGVADIGLAVARSTSVLWLNASNLTIEKAAFRPEGGASLDAKVVAGGTSFAGFAFDAPLAPGTGTLHIAYQGKIQRTSSAGVFQLRDGSQPPWYVYTQFEPTDARRAFPCFDEPKFKTPWQLTLHVPQDDLAAANAPIASEKPEAGGMKRVEFARTRPLPSYLVAFAVGPFEAVAAGPGGRNKVPLRILVPAGRSADAAFARGAIPELLNLLEKYFDSPYPYEKLDSVVMPIGGFAMENVGLITYGQGTLLSKPALATTQWQRGCAAVAAHEMAHQWFGDLVTTSWWDDIWLNEAFATWLESKIVDQWKPEWKMPVGAVQSSQGAMGMDSLVSARRIRQPIESDNDIANAFDGITYEKGAAVIGMFESWIGEKPFRDGVQLYMKLHADQASTTREFLAAISQAAGRDVAPAFNSFLDQAGVPLVTAELRCGDGPPRLALTQKRSLPIGSQGSAKESWSIPVCVKYSAAGAIQRECSIFNDPSSEIKLSKASACPAWLLANDGEVGYYRVLYRGDLLDRLLTDRGSRLSTAELVGVLGDVSALANSGNLPQTQALALVEPFSQDPDWRVVSETIGIAGMLRSPIVPDELRPNAARFIRKAFGERAHQLGWVNQPGDSDDTRSLRRQLVGLVATEGEDEQLTAEARKLGLRWLDDHTAVDPDIAGTVLNIAARQGDQALFDCIHAAAHKSQDRRERSQLIGAMASFRNPAIARQRMALVLTEEFDLREMFFAFLYSSTPETRRLPFEFVRQNIDALLKKVPRVIGGDYAAYLPGVGGGFCSATDRADLEAFFKPRVEQYSGGPRYFAQVIEGIDLCIASRAALGPSLAEFLKTY